MNDVNISVLLPVYNSSKTIGPTVESLLTQSFTDFELLIVDDGSVDDTLVKLELLASQDSRVKIISKEHSGLGATLNYGLQIAKGKYIARIDADDVAHEDRLALQFEYMESNPHISVLGANVETVYSDGSVLVRKRSGPHEEILKNICKVCPVVHPTVMVKASAIRNVGGYDENRDGSLGRSMGMDYYLWIDMLAEGHKFANLNEILLSQYKSSHSIQGSKSLLFKLVGRTKIRMYAKSRLSVGFSGVFHIIGVGVITIISHLGLKTDWIYNSIAKQSSFEKMRFNK